jgi:hypothetical protein
LVSEEAELEVGVEGERMGKRFGRVEGKERVEEVEDAAVVVGAKIRRVCQWRVVCICGRDGDEL